ncbi:MAG: ABC transporter ATP-binding protein [Planctomycetota bacterium]|nr:ABC transporter ATP-binding protein [Planctomycetota bacterium]
MTPRRAAVPPAGRLDVAIRSFSYGDRVVLRGVSFSADPGELLAVLGPNGSGKTTLFRILAGSADLRDGSVSYAGLDVLRLPLRDRCRIFSLMSQMRESYLPYTALEIVLMGRSAAGGDGFFETREGIGRAMATMAAVGAEALAGRRMDRLSAGERQRVFLARCLNQDAPVMLLDEPTNFLDVRAQADLEAIVEETHRRGGKTIIMITHDLNQALRLADRALLLKDGVPAALGSPCEVLTPQRILDVYGARMRWTADRPGAGVFLVPERNGRG